MLDAFLTGPPLSGPHYPTPNAERDALLNFLSESSRQAALADWGADGSHCSWSGVTCNDEGHVEMLWVPCPIILATAEPSDQVAGMLLAQADFRLVSVSSLICQ